jgi:hypothetical protein
MHIVPDLSFLIVMYRGEYGVNKSLFQDVILSIAPVDRLGIYIAVQDGALD